MQRVNLDTANLIDRPEQHIPCWLEPPALSKPWAWRAIGRRAETEWAFIGRLGKYAWDEVPLPSHFF